MTDDPGERTEIAVPRLGPALIALTVSRKPDHVLRGYDESQVPEGHRSWRGVPAVRAARRRASVPRGRVRRGRGRAMEGASAG